MTIGSMYTLGYAAKSASFILESLLAEPGTLLVDARMHPGSHRYPEWRGSALERRYGERYVHVPAFGDVHYRTPGQPIQLVDPEAGVRWAIPSLHQGRNLVLLCICKDYEQCHRKLVFDLLTLRLADSLRPLQQMRYEPAPGLYQGLTSDGLGRVSVVPDIFDGNHDLMKSSTTPTDGQAKPMASTPGSSIWRCLYECSHHAL